MNYNELKEKNRPLSLKRVSDEAFLPYGKVIAGYDFSGLIRFMERETTVPGDGNVYRASVTEMEQHPVKTNLENGFYGEMPIQIGYCNGRNSSLNGLEYHIGSEIDVAVTNMVLMLGRVQDVADGEYHAGTAEVFYVPAGTAVQLYETTLHFSPCKTNAEGFKCIVILPRGTNEPLKNDRTAFGDRFLFARNKWLLAHPERKPLIEKGAWPGIKGANLELKIS